MKSAWAHNVRRHSMINMVCNISLGIRRCNAHWLSFPFLGGMQDLTASRVKSVSMNDPECGCNAINAGLRAIDRWLLDFLYREKISCLAEKHHGSPQCPAPVPRDFARVLPDPPPNNERFSFLPFPLLCFAFLSPLPFLGQTSQTAWESPC